MDLGGLTFSFEFASQDLVWTETRRCKSFV